MVPGHNFSYGRSQNYPFESDDESDCWSDVDSCASRTSTTSSFLSTVSQDACDYTTDDEEEDEETSVTLSFDKQEEEPSLDSREEEEKHLVEHYPFVMTTPDKKFRIQQFSPSPIPRRTPIVKWKRLAGGAFMERPPSSRSEMKDLKLRHDDAISRLEATALELEQSQNRCGMLREELDTVKHQRDDANKVLNQKEQELANVKIEFTATQKLLQCQQSSPSSLASILQQRNHAVAAVVEKDRLLQLYREKIDDLELKVAMWRQREEDTTSAFQKELEILQESLELVRTPVSREEESESNEENDNNTSGFFGCGKEHQNPDRDQIFMTEACSNRQAFRQVASLNDHIT